MLIERAPSPGYAPRRPRLAVIAGGGRIAEYDALRLIAIVAVIGIHVSAPILTARGAAASGTLLLFVNGLLRFSVPAFVFITGALLWTRTYEAGYAAYQRFMRHRFEVIVVPYLVWSAVYLVLRYAWTRPLPRGSAGLLPAIVMDDLLRGGASAQLYFVPAVLMIYLLAPLASRVIRRWPSSSLVATTVLATVGPTAVHAVLGAKGIEQFLLSLLLSLMPYAAAGAWFELRRRRGIDTESSVWLWLLLAGVALTWLVGGRTDLGLAGPALQIVRRLASVVGLWGVSSMLLERRPALEGLLERAGRSVYGVFLAHPALMLLFAAIPGEVAVVRAHGAFGMLAELAVVTAASFGLVALLRRTPVARFVS